MTAECTTTADRQCMANTCTCPNGTPTISGGSGGNLCDTNDQVDCSACNTGYTISNPPAAGSAQTCVINTCTPTQVSSSDKAEDGSITGKTGATVTVTCNAGYSQCVDLQYSVDGVMSPYHERNGETNTCAMLTLNNLCTSDYFNTYNSVKVEASKACCGCGGGTGTGTADITATCSTDGSFNTVRCGPNTCTPTGNIANSNKAAAGSITGTTSQSVSVICDTGFNGKGKIYVDGHFQTSCTTSGSFTTLPTCVPKTCTPTGNIADSDKTKTGSITGKTKESVTVTCNAGYSGTGATVCQPNGKFSDVQCVKCVLGKYNDAPDQPLCKDDCGAGSYIVQDRSSCDSCPYGTWQDEDDKSSCKKCAAGRISKKSKQISGSTCEECVIGQYNPYEGHSDSCLACPGAARKGASICDGW